MKNKEMKTRTFLGTGGALCAGRRVVSVLGRGGIDAPARGFGGAAWHASAESRRALLGWWGVQCVLNFLWSVCFFYARSPWAGMVVIVALLVAVVVFMVKSRRACRVAFGCFVPYLLWLAFAAYLNAYVCLYN